MILDWEISSHWEALELNLFILYNVYNCTSAFGFLAAALPWLLTSWVTRTRIFVHSFYHLQAANKLIDVLSETWWIYKIILERRRDQGVEVLRSDVEERKQTQGPGVTARFVQRVSHFDGWTCCRLSTGYWRWRTTPDMIAEQDYQREMVRVHTSLRFYKWNCGKRTTTNLK